MVVRWVSRPHGVLSTEPNKTKPKTITRARQTITIGAIAPQNACTTHTHTPGCARGKYTSQVLRRQKKSAYKSYYYYVLVIALHRRYFLLLPARLATRVVSADVLPHPTKTKTRYSTLCPAEQLLAVSKRANGNLRKLTGLAIRCGREGIIEG